MSQGDTSWILEPHASSVLPERLCSLPYRGRMSHKNDLNLSSRNIEEVIRHLREPRSAVFTCERSGSSCSTDAKYVCTCVHSCQ